MLCCSDKFFWLIGALDAYRAHGRGLMSEDITLSAVYQALTTPDTIGTKASRQTKKYDAIIAFSAVIQRRKPHLLILWQVN